MSTLLRLIAASLVATLVGAAPISSAGIIAATKTEESVDARATNEDPRPGDAASAESERDLVARLFLGSLDRKYVRLANAAYPWLTTGNVYWVYEQHRVLVVAVPGNGKSPILLTGDPKATATFLSKQSGGRFADVEAIAGLLRDVAIGPATTIGTPDLLLDPADLRDWMSGRQKDPSVFESFCRGLQRRQRNNEWQLQFNVFNTKGGVDSVSASGTVSPFTIRKLRVTPLKPAGEFHYPFSG